MKFNDMKGILLLITITLSIVSTNSLTSQSARSLTKRRTYTKSKNSMRTKQGLSDIFTVLSKAIQDPLYIFDFLLGIISEFVPQVEKYFNEFIAFAGYFKDCFGFLASNEKEEKIESFRQYETSLKTPEEKIKYCENMKFDVRYINACANAEDRNPGTNCYQDFEKTGNERKVDDSRMGLSVFVGKWFMTSNSLCKEVFKKKAPLLQTELIKRFGSMEGFIEQCKYFDSINCKKFNPVHEGITAFAKQAYSYYDSIKTTASCIGKIYSERYALIKDKGWELFKKILAPIFTVEDFLKTLAQQALGFALHILTAGVWGGIKATYHLIKLGEKIKDLWDTFAKLEAHKMVFKIGTIFGKALTIVKSLLLGRRRFRRRIR